MGLLSAPKTAYIRLVGWLLYQSIQSYFFFFFFKAPFFSILIIVYCELYFRSLINISNKDWLFMYYLLNYMYIEKSTSLNFEIGVLEM